MTIDPVVSDTAGHFGLDPKLVQAVVESEGGHDAIIRAVECSIQKPQTYEQAIAIVCRSLVHRAFGFIHTSGLDRAYVGYFSGFWAPIGAPNDPTGLNKNFPSNLIATWLRS
jgi:hypothetical protein